jgi:hypothetical protein
MDGSNHFATETKNAPSHTYDQIQTHECSIHTRAIEKWQKSAWANLPGDTKFSES